LVVGYQLIGVSSAVAKKVRKHRLKKVNLILVTIQTGGHRTRIRLSLSVI
jgi:hypothetical protein